MSKNKVSKKEDKYEFKFPEFNEKEYIKKEIEDTKLLFAIVIYATIISIFSYFLYKFVGFTIGIFIGIFCIFGIKFIILPLNIDLKNLEKSAIFYTIIMYIFTWLSIQIVLLNTIK